MKVFVTGGTGFIGKRVVAKLVERGDEVYALTRSVRSAEAVESLGAHAVRGELKNLAVLHEAMRGCDLVFHIAAWYALGIKDLERMSQINVEGTRNVLETAHQLGVPKIVYVSTVAVFGDTHGELVDEQFFQAGPFLTHYDRTKWQAHYEVAVPLIEKGAPIIIVLPGAVYGPGDQSLIGEMMRQFYFRSLPFAPGKETALTFAHVDDVAQGLLLAASKGRPGESYILAGPNLTLGELFDLWAQILGRRPRKHLSVARLRAFLPLLSKLEGRVPLPPLFSRESLSIVGATYLARSDKAKAELGWQPRPVREGMQETLLALVQEYPAPKAAARRNRQRAAMAILWGGILMAFWTIFQRKGRQK